MLAKTARFEKLLDDLPRHVANVNGLNRNLHQLYSEEVNFAAILHCSSFSEVIMVRNRAAKISVNEKTIEIANSGEGMRVPRIEKNANNNGAYSVNHCFQGKCTW
jgi:hypothetical protein